MAGLDYISCIECGKRLIYDGDDYIRDYISKMETTEGICCSHCVSKLKKKIEKLKKHDRRRH
jgi:DNA-directed RNA polymerase subunit RPC12/RpoP